MRKVKQKSLWGAFLILFFFSPLYIEASQTGSSLKNSEETAIIDESDGDTEDLDEDLSEDISDEELDQIIEQYFHEIQMDEFENSGGEKLPDSQEIMKTIPLKEMVMEKDSSGNLRYSFPDGNYFTSSVPWGMVSSKPVDVRISPGNVGIVRHDDTINALSDSWHFTENGNYEIQVLSYQNTSGKIEKYQAYETYFFFRIVSELDSTLGAVPAPQDFQISKVVLDGKEQKIENPRAFFLGRDGRYEIEYTSQKYPDFVMKTSFVHDTTAPFLSFSPELQNREAAETVEFFPSEPDCKVYMVYNGEQGYAVSNKLTVAGNYDLIVEDTAKNQRKYHLKIRQVYKIIDFRVIGTGMILLLLMGIRFFFLRRDMKII